jgi:hypothetical protein
MTQPVQQETVSGGVVPGSPGTVLQLGHSTAHSQAPAATVTKVVVAVHGVGDQHTYATIQAVVNQFLRFYSEPAAHPLGLFHTDEPAYSLQPPYAADCLRHVAFAEVYWAKIPREAVADKYTLEETKKWGRTIVERLRMRWRDNRRNTGDDGECIESDFDRLGEVLGEMISTVAVLERLCYLADRAGLFTFDLRKLVDDYLGDVQIVAEFGKLRRRILDEFATTLDKVHAAYPNAEIYLVAHSEGTVVSFLALLEAARAASRPAWLERVRGLMTFGSPIDKHLVLWPELFGDAAPAQPLEPPIEWRNYYDRGDPIGFALDGTREWLREHRWEGVFHFADEHDVGFIRYAFPGKAHVDYWHDSAVFQHFIDTVVEAPPDGSGPPASADAAAGGAAATSRPAAGGPPADIPWTKWSSYVLPYVAVVALLAVAVYVLFKAVTGYLEPEAAKTLATVVIARKVGAIAVLLFGVTVAVRVPRLTRLWQLRWRAGAAYLLAAAAFLWIVPPRQPDDRGVEGWSQLVETSFGVELPSGGTRLILATLLVILASWVSASRPRWGLGPLLILGAAAVASVVVTHLLLANTAAEEGPIWPVFLAGAAFLYLWWLAALVFDLVFVWHVYVRQAAAVQRVRRLCAAPRRAASAEATGLDDGGAAAAARV